MFIKMDSTWTSKPSMLGIDLDALIAMYWVQHSNLLSTFHQLNTKINITVKVISFFHPMPCRLRMVIYIYILKNMIRFPLWSPWWYMHFGVFFTQDEPPSLSDFLPFTTEDNLTLVVSVWCTGFCFRECILLFMSISLFIYHINNINTQ